MRSKTMVTGGFAVVEKLCMTVGKPKEPEQIAGKPRGPENKQLENLKFGKLAAEHTS